MEHRKEKNSPLQVGAWRIDPHLHRLRRDQETVQLGPRIMQLLLALAARPREVVTREELMATVWSDAVVSEETLTVAISDLRRCLGDDPQHPTYIETIRKGGYRLIAPVSQPTSYRASPRTRWRLAAGGLALALAILGSIWWALRPDRPGGVPLTFIPVPLTSYPSSEIMPAISSDGGRVAFAWGGPEQKDLDIYVKQINTDPPMRLTEDPAAELFPAWSPDGAEIAFVRAGAEPGLFIVPAIGGFARRIVALPETALGLDWSPDGSALIYAVRPAPGAAHIIMEVTLATRTILPRTEGSFPACSPDGTTLAFVRADRAGMQDIWVLPRGADTARRLTHGQRRIDGLDWTADGRAVVFAASPAGVMELWRARLRDGALSWLAVPGDLVQYPSIAQQDGRLVYEDTSYNDDIWEIRRTAAGAVDIANTALIASTHEDTDAAFSWDGTRIAFLSTRSGSRELWICDRDGSRPWQLGQLEGIFASDPQWSPDGQSLAFRGVEQGWAGIYIIDLATQRFSRLHPIGEHEVLPCWSRDGAWIYFTALVGSGTEIRRCRPDGSACERLIADATGPLCEAAGSTDLLYFRAGLAGIWRRALNGGESICIASGENLGRWREIAPCEGGFFINRPKGFRYELWYLDLETGALDSLATVNRFSCSHLAAARDGSRLLYDHADRMHCDLMLVEPFGK